MIEVKRPFKIITLLFLLMSVSVFKVQAVEVEKPPPVITAEMLNKLTPEQAYQTGKLMQQQMKNGAPYLKYAADKGLAKAARGYAETKSLGMLLQSPEESEYVLKAAKLGSVKSMIHAGSSSSLISRTAKKEWKNKAHKLLVKQEQNGSVKATYMLYSGFYLDNKSEGLRWLKKAAKKGYPVAQRDLALLYFVGEDWFIIPGKREKEIRRLYKAAADSGHVKARLAYMGILEKEGNVDQALEQLMKNIDDGDAESLHVLANIYLGLDETIGVEHIDRIKGIAYNQIFVRAMGTETGNQRVRGYIQEDYIKLYEILTETEKKQVDSIADAYLTSHTVRMFDVFWVFDE